MELFKKKNFNILFLIFIFVCLFFLFLYIEIKNKKKNKEMFQEGLPIHVDDEIIEISENNPYEEIISIPGPPGPPGPPGQCISSSDLPNTNTKYVIVKELKGNNYTQMNRNIRNKNILPKFRNNNNNRICITQRRRRLKKKNNNLLKLLNEDQDVDI